MAGQLAAAAGAQWTAEAAMQSGVVRISGLSCISVPASCPVVRVRTAALLRYRSPRGLSRCLTGSVCGGAHIGSATASAGMSGAGTGGCSP